MRHADFQQQKTQTVPEITHIQLQNSDENVESLEESIKLWRKIDENLI